MARIVTGALTTLRLDQHIDPQTLDLYTVLERFKLGAYASFGAYTGSNWKISVDASGRVALNSDPSSWTSTITALDFGPIGAVFCDTATSALGNNLYFDGTNWRAKTTGVAGRVQVFNQELYFSWAASVSAGSVLTLIDGFKLGQNGYGYQAGFGVGGSVTQATSKSTNVTLNKPTGQVILNGAALAAGTAVNFNINNTTVAATDCIVMGLSGTMASAGNYNLWWYVSANTIQVWFKNISGGSLSEAPTINFTVLKGAAT